MDRLTQVGSLLDNFLGNGGRASRGSCIKAWKLCTTFRTSDKVRGSYVSRLSWSHYFGERPFSTLCKIWVLKIIFSFGKKFQITILSNIADSKWNHTWERRDYRLKSMKYQVRSNNRDYRIVRKFHAETYSPYHYLETFETIFRKGRYFI